ncbi:hypothetical protein O181_013564 [Austropuccinia psidii MF-1]|uniref:Uncharacterized protein n=1 Tax=Austropuccinia psidii MF-1 TaxID=1389203 RepID=A0A9Q3BWM7_9BASI|nr:hypothetical protein [Austropuccinia psidii MF-1]
MTSIGTIIKEIIIPNRKGNIRFKPEFLVLEDAHIQDKLINQFKEGKFSANLTSKQKLSLLRTLRKNRPAFAIGEEPLGKIRSLDIEIYINVERLYQPILRRPPYLESLESSREIAKQVNNILEMYFIRKIGHNGIIELPTTFLITWHNGNSRWCGDFRELNNYTKPDRYPRQRIPHSLDKMEKSEYITKVEQMKGFHQNGVKQTP